MPVPKPPASLDNSCSVIHDNTLYVYSPDAFLSIRLEDGASWNKLPMGVKVTGAVCVGTTPPDDKEASFFVVGGEGPSEEYTGLQKFVYSTGKWTTVTPSELVTKHRKWHSATYIKANNAILVYAGSQDGINGPSGQTFTIEASEPYKVQGYEATAPPAVSPVLLDWSAADAALIGGGTDARNRIVHLFNPAARWRDSGASLAQPLLQDTSVQRAALIDGADGSKSLYIFDLSQSPNLVTRFVLQDAKGVPVHDSVPIVSSAPKKGDSKVPRDLTMDKWPEYNATLAPKAIRRNFAMAQGPNGMVVFSGGSPDSPLAIFDAKENGWVDPAAVFSAKDQTALATPSKSSTSSTSTSSSSSTSSTSITTSTNLADVSSTSQSVLPSATTSDEAAALGQHDNNSNLSPNSILGITLGSILGLLALLGIVLFCLRRRKKRHSHTEAGQKSKAAGEKDNLTKRDVKSKSPGQYRRHYPQTSQESYSSMAILMGRVGKDGTALTRKASNGTNRSSVSSLHKQFKSTISKPIPQTTSQPALGVNDDRGVVFAPSVAKPRPRNGPTEAQEGIRRSSGWNRYWSGSSALQVLGFGSGKRDTVSSGQSSRYSEATSSNIMPGGNNLRTTQDSATVPVLDFGGRPEVNNVNSRSPVVSHYPNIHSEGYAGKIERHLSESTSGYTSGVPESINEAWDYEEADRAWNADRVLAQGQQAAGPAVPGTSFAPPPRQPPTGVSRQPQLATAAKSSDMSWLNLGEYSRRL
ncbi:hypothetical protein CDD81_4324 [Ophiocordyceps australis]|uniref:Pre-mRNA splicing factor CLF1 n=1 Tax=Ophiocordyceps australis TaxID=1399860 RepID=A0A2C5Y4X6_9HYPO|nr:hypothetical protein CDD81_4324 [Ophiocordyceps australis]